MRCPAPGSGPMDPLLADPPVVGTAQDLDGETSDHHPQDSSPGSTGPLAVLQAARSAVWGNSSMATDGSKGEGVLAPRSPPPAGGSVQPPRRSPARRWFGPAGAPPRGRSVAERAPGAQEAESRCPAVVAGSALHPKWRLRPRGGGSGVPRPPSCHRGTQGCSVAWTQCQPLWGFGPNLSKLLSVAKLRDWRVHIKSGLPTSLRRVIGLSANSHWCQFNTNGSPQFGVWRRN